MTNNNDLATQCQPIRIGLGLLAFFVSVFLYQCVSYRMHIHCTSQCTTALLGWDHNICVRQTEGFVTLILMQIRFL